MFAVAVFVLWAMLSLIPLEYNYYKPSWLTRFLTMPLLCVVLVPFLIVAFVFAIPFMIVTRRKSVTIGKLTFNALW